ncbi:MAG TPA: hypothetical protein VL486_14115 [Verrucomicrobiae bacterium]|nr:hypothetical protein [Verrucomicrobiae bacterium]
MKREFLGDSYDAVKRMWREMLADWAPLYAEPRFFPDEQLRRDFAKLTGIPMLADNRPATYSILNDPDTGIRLPSETNQTEGRTHIAIPTIVDQLRMQAVRCVITFDQSNYRNADLGKEEQRRAKMQCLVQKGFHCFYYVSHAPFLFAAPDPDMLDELRKLLISAGIPDRDDRFQNPQ